MHWLSIPEVQIRYNLRATGKPDLGWHFYCLSFMPRERIGRGRMLVLGCGSGWLERALYRHGAFSECVVVDPSAEAVETARALAAAEGCRRISYSVSDLGTVELPAARYDAVWSDNILSRSPNLDRLSAQIARSLSPGGFLFANEYTGANRYAFSLRQREAIQAAYSLIPRRYQLRANGDDGPSNAPGLPGPEGDQSDSAPIASAQVIRTLEERFEVVQRRALGGTILQFALHNIASNFKPGDRIAELVLEMLFRIEDALVDSGELASDFSLLVARQKGA